MHVNIIETLAGISQSLCRARDKASLFSALSDSVSAFGFDDFFLSCHKPRKQDLFLAPTLTSLPAAMLAEYGRRNLSDSDPILARAAETSVPFDWKASHPVAEEQHRGVMDFLKSHEVHSGLVIPLCRRPGTISVIGLTARGERDFDAATTSAATVVATTALLKADLIGLCPRPEGAADGLDRLSGQQADILQWASRGKSNVDIATITGLSERAVKYHVSEILRKLGVATRAQAIALVQRAGDS